MYAANTDLSKSIALITGTNAVVQDPSSVGNMWKTVSMRIRGTKQELEAAGEDVDGMVESTSKLRDIIKGLTGFDIMADKAGTQFKDVYDIVVGIGKEWKNLSDIEQAGLLEALAGKRQGNALSAALNNISMIENAYDTATNSAGSALKEQQEYEKGIQYSLDRLTASAQTFANHFLDSSLVKGIVDFGNTTINVIDKVTSALTPLGTLALGGGIFASFKNAGIFKTIGTGDDTQVVNLLKAKKIAQDELNASLAEQASVLETDTLELRKLETAVANGATYEEAFASSIKNASTAAKEHAIQTKGASGSTDVFVSKQRSAQASLRATATASKTASVAMRALSMAMNMIVIGLITKGLELLGSAISNYIHRVEKANEKIEESRSSYEDAKSSIESMNDELKTTQDKIDDLQSKGTLSFTDKAELDNLKAQNDELERSISLEEKKKQNAASQTVNDIKQNKDTLSDDFEESIKNLSEYQEEYEHMKQVGIKGISDGTVTPENYEVTMTAMDKNMDLYEKHVLENIEKFEKYKEDIINKYNTDDVSQFSQSDRDLYNSIVSQLQKAYKTIYSDSDYNKFVIEPIFNQDKLKGLQDQLLQYFVNGGSTDTSALEEKFGADIITALRNACERAGIDFDKMIGDIYNNSQSKLNQIAPIVTTPTSAYDAKQNSISKQIRDYIQNDLSEEDRTILLNAEIPDDVKFRTKQDVDNYIASLKADVDTNKTDILSFSDAWNSKDFEDVRKELLSLAEAGQLTPETLQSTEKYKTLLEQTGLSAEEAAKKINSMTDASTQLQSMSTQISKMSDMLADKKNGTTASASDLAGFDATVKGLESWDEFERVMGSSKSSMEECQAAANALATEWVNNGNFLANLTEENKDYYITQMSNMGIENASAIVTDVLTQKKQALALATEFATAKGKDLSNATFEEINAFIEDNKIVGEARNALYRLALAKQGVNAATLSFDGDITNIKNYVKALGGAAYALSMMEQIKNNPSVSIPSEARNQILKQAQIEVETVTNTPADVGLSDLGSFGYKPSGGSGGSRGGSRGGSKTKETKQTIDWIERKITILNNKIDAFATKASDAWSSWTSRTKALNSEMETTKKLLTSVYGISSKTQKKLNSQRDSAKNKLDKYVKKNSKVLTSSTIKKINSGKLDASKLSRKDKKVIEEYKKLQKDYNKKASKAKKASEKNPAADYYFAKANKVAKKYKLSPAIIKKIKNGTISISDYNESMANAIQKYQDYYDKGKDAQKSKKETKQKLNELAQQNFELIQSKWDARIGYQENRKNAVSDALNLAQSKGQLIGAAYYTKQKGINDKEINKYKQEETELKKAMKGVKKYSEQWYQYKADLSEVHSKYVQLQADNAELQNSINELKFDRFDELINKFGDITDEANFLIDMLDSDNLFNSDNGSITNDGITAMGLTAQNYDVYLAKDEQYKKQIADLEQMYKNGEIGLTQYNSQMRELQEGYRDSIRSANDAKKAVIDYVKQGLDAQNEALSKSIDKQKELLESEKDLHDFQSKIADQNKNIANLRKQIAALEGDDSEENRKKLQQLKSDLQDAEKEQADTLYDRSVSDQEKALDDMLTKSQDAAESYLKDSEKVFVDALNYVNKNTSQVSQNLEKISKDLGYDISTYITNAWKDGGDAVGTYESTLSSNVPKITAQIQLITNAWNAQCEAANKAAQASAKAAAGTDETTKDTDKKGNSSNGSGNKSKTSSAKDIKRYITDHVDKAKQKKSYYGALNRYLYEKTGGKVLSVSEEVQLAKMLGVSVKKDLSGTGDRQKILDALKKKKIAFANGGVLGDLVKLSGEDGLFIGSAGESILTKEQTQALINFRPVIPQLNTMVDLMKNVPISSASQSPTYNIEVSNNVSGAVSQETLNEMRKIATNQAETVIKKINSATYAKGVRK